MRGAELGDQPGPVGIGVRGDQTVGIDGRVLGIECVLQRRALFGHVSITPAWVAQAALIDARRPAR